MFSGVYVLQNIRCYYCVIKHAQLIHLIKLDYSVGDNGITLVSLGIHTSF